MAGYGLSQEALVCRDYPRANLCGTQEIPEIIGNWLESFTFEQSPFSDGFRGSGRGAAGWGGDMGTLGEVHQEGRSLTRFNTLALTIAGEGRFWSGVGLGLQAPRSVVETRAECVRGK